MIWRLPRPVRGVVASLLVLVAGADVAGFGAGRPELAGLTVLAGVAFVVAGTRTPAERDAARTRVD